jgi:hypothetical protein
MRHEQRQRVLAQRLGDRPIVIGARDLLLHRAFQRDDVIVRDAAFRRVVLIFLIASGASFLF